MNPSSDISRFFTWTEADWKKASEAMVGRSARRRRKQQTSGKPRLTIEDMQKTIQAIDVRGWNQGSFVGPDGEVCLMGGFSRGAGYSLINESMLDRFAHELGFQDTDDAIDWNDEPERKKKEVIARIQKAIDRRRGKLNRRKARKRGTPTAMDIGEESAPYVVDPAKLPVPDTMPLPQRERKFSPNKPAEPVKDPTEPVKVPSK
jgi:hypothetical protein